MTQPTNGDHKFSVLLSVALVSLAYAIGIGTFLLKEHISPRVESLLYAFIGLGLFPGILITLPFSGSHGGTNESMWFGLALSWFFYVWLFSEVVRKIREKGTRQT